MTRILIVAGDPSGDLYGSMLIEALRRARPALRIDAAGGPLIKRALNPGDAFATHWREGRRDVGLRILAMLDTDAPDGPGAQAEEADPDGDGA